MTIDERIERLTERHEALAQTMELMILENQQRDKRMLQILQGIEAMGNMVLGQKGEISELKASSLALLELATNHERRLTNLERPN